MRRETLRNGAGPTPQRPARPGCVQNTFGEARAGQSPSPRELIACGEICLKNDAVCDALKAFEAAEHRPGLIICGERFLTRDLPTEAQRAFEAADRVEDKSTQAVGAPELPPSGRLDARGRARGRPLAGDASWSLRGRINLMVGKPR